MLSIAASAKTQEADGTYFVRIDETLVGLKAGTTAAWLQGSDILLGAAGAAAIGKGHRRALAEPLLPEVTGLAESLELA